MSVSVTMAGVLAPKSLLLNVSRMATARNTRIVTQPPISRSHTLHTDTWRTGRREEEERERERRRGRGRGREGEGEKEQGGGERERRNREGGRGREGTGRGGEGERGGF